MPRFEQKNHPLQITTPLGPDKLLAAGLNGTEAISQLYHFQLDCLAHQEDSIDFDKILGENISVKLELPGKRYRYFSGICSRISQGSSDPEFTVYSLEMVPALWFLTRKKQSRIFQHKNVPDILKEVLTGLTIQLNLQGTFEPRDYCVQYRESDFDFASRLMEEEGIYYYFKHSENGATMVLGNAPGAHESIPYDEKVTVVDAGLGIDANREQILELAKSQEVISGKMTLWDHCFELPHKNLEATKTNQATVAVGAVSHKLVQSKSTNLELYDFPGAYAQRFDGITPGGGEQPSEINKIFIDNQRTLGIRSQQESARAISLTGASTCRRLVPGHKAKFETIAESKSAKTLQADGMYVITSVSHHCRADNYRSGNQGNTSYQNTFHCIPLALPFRPQRVTPRPVVHGSQTAVVVGPAGQEIFTDKYGRVKVQFHWDRQGKRDANSSCWIRVATSWAGKGWGMLHIPRIGQEVVVDFLEGDPDQPIIVGSVWNAEQMPHYKLPDDMNKSYLKSNTTMGGQGFNEIRFDDTKDKQQIFFHAERNCDTRVKNDDFETILGNQHLIVGDNKAGKKFDRMEEVNRDQHTKIGRHQHEHIGGNYLLKVGYFENGAGNMDVIVEKNHKMTVEGNDHLVVKESSLEKIGKDKVINASSSILTDAGSGILLNAAQEIYIKAGMNIILEAGAQISLKVGGNFVDVSAAGVAINGTMVLINSGGSAGSGSLKKGPDAEAATKAEPVAPTLADNSNSGQKSC